MASPENQPDKGDSESVPFMQRVIDNPFLLLFLGVAIPGLLYLVWGVVEVANLPIAR
jgi:hypothetical protein